MRSLFARNRRPTQQGKKGKAKVVPRLDFELIKVFGSIACMLMETSAEKAKLWVILVSYLDQGCRPKAFPEQMRSVLPRAA